MNGKRADNRAFARAAFGTAVAATVGLALVVPARAVVTDGPEGEASAAERTDGQVGNQTKQAASETDLQVNQASQAEQEAARPMKVGTRVQDATAMTYGSDRVTEISHPGATYIKVSFDDLQLAAGDYLTVSDPEGDEVHTYHGDPRSGEQVQGDAGYTRHGKNGIGALSVQGDTAIVELHSDTDNASTRATRLDDAGFGVRINGYWRGYDDAELAEANPLSVCGEDAREDAICYQESQPQQYDKARAVARLLIGGTTGCTAFRVGDGNAVMTNNHCVADQGGIETTEVQFDYECATCGGDDPKEPTTVVGAEMLKTSAALDYTLFSVQDFESITDFGTLYLETREATQGEPIVIPGHGDLDPKRLSVFEEPGGGDPCTITEPDSGDGVNLGYSCDTSGGNSGSPVIAADTLNVIALHHLGGCPGGSNAGTRMALIYPEVQDLIENG